MKRSYRGAIWLVTIGVLFFFSTGCRKRIVGGMEYAFSYFFIPSGIGIGEEENNRITVHLYKSDAIDEEHHTDLHRQMIKEYDLPKCEVYGSSYGPPPRKPIYIKSIKVYLHKNETKVDVSDQFEIKFTDMEAYVAKVRASRLYEGSASRDKVRTVKLNELTENDLKWLPEQFELYSQLANKQCLTLQIEVKGEPIIIKKL